MSKIHRRRPLGYRFALGALDAAERLRQVGSREAVQQMVYDQLRILGATQRTTSQLTNANGQVERQMSRSHHPVEKAMALIPVRDARQSYPPFDAIFSPFKHGSIRYGRTASAADRAVLVQLRRFLAVIQALGTPRYHKSFGRSRIRTCDLVHIRQRGACAPKRQFHVRASASVYGCLSYSCGTAVGAATPLWSFRP